jgi:hypothetical protein
MTNDDPMYPSAPIGTTSAIVALLISVMGDR